ncbi:UNVERIFIED_CONTAM: hypothetical protein FKN15_059974 [Acipenser sinensis]
MEHPSVKQERLGDEETSCEVEHLTQYVRELEKELAQMDEQVRSSTGRWQSLVTERMGPSWVQQSATPDTRCQEKPWAERLDGGDSTAGSEAANL